ncbi:MAG: hypothetical protein WC570_04190 [Patescibacteria group bacterium]
MKKSIMASVLVLISMSGCDAAPKVMDEIKTAMDESQGGYVSEMTTDADGFVRFPGEPTRESKDYYIIEDICGQFTAEFMKGVTGKEIDKAIDPYEEIGGTYVCHYYFAGNESEVASLYLVLDYLNVENQKKGLEFLDRRIETAADIPMEHFIAVQEDGNINGIYFVLGPDKFIRLDRSSGQVVSNEEMRAYATKIGQKIKNYK